MTDLIRCCNKCQRTVFLYGFCQLLQAQLIYEHKHDPVIILWLILFRYFLVCGSFLIPALFSIYCNCTALNCHFTPPFMEYSDA